MQFAQHIENRPTGERGSIEVICGSMFSGKTEELMRRLRRAKFANQRIEIFKPKIDTRYDIDVIGIDEAQFFDDGLVNVVQELADRGVRIIIAGLDMDFRRTPFGPMANLCAIADSVDKIHAICVECGRLANYSYRLIEGDAQVLLGEMSEYSPLCRMCYNRHQNKTNS